MTYTATNPPELNQVLATRSTEEGAEIWMGIGYGDDPANSGIGIYHMETQTLERFTNRLDDVSQTIFVSDVFVDSQQQVWGQIHWARSADVETVPLLSLFNESTRRFEVPENAPIIPFETTGVYSSGRPASSHIILDHENIFWIFAGDFTLYRYDTHTGETSTIAQLGRIENISLSADGDTIYYERHTGDVTLHVEDLFLAEFDIASEQPERMDFPETIDDWNAYSGAPFEDAQGRLWLGPVGFRDVNREWHLINPSLASIRASQPYHYMYAMPKLIMQSSDGRLWYTRYMDGMYPEGTAWYDPATGEGCLFTKSPASIVEDSNQTLWMTAYGTLYNLPLNPPTQ